MGKVPLEEQPDFDPSILRDLLPPGESEAADRLRALLRDVAEALDLRLPDGRVIPVAFTDIAHLGRCYPNELGVVLSTDYVTRYVPTYPHFLTNQRRAVLTYVHECSHRLVSMLPYTGSWADRSHGLIFGITNLAILIRAVSLRHDHPFLCISDFDLSTASARTSFLSATQADASRIYNWADIVEPAIAANDRRPASCVQEWDLFSLWMLFGIRAAARFAVSDLPPADIARQASELAERYLPDFTVRPAWARQRPWDLVYPAARRAAHIRTAADRFIREFFDSSIFMR